MLTRRASLVVTIVLACLLWSLTPASPALSTQSAAACPATTGWSNLGSNGLIESDSWNSGATTVTNRFNLLSISAGWEDSSTIYLGARNVLYRTRDCGSTWGTVWGTKTYPDGSKQSYSVRLLLILPGGRIYFAGDNDQPIQVSDDYGASLSNGGRTAIPLQLASSVSQQDVVFALVQTSGGNGGYPFVRQSTDGGQTWLTVNRSVRGGAMIADPRDSSVVYLLNEGTVLKSTDGARTFGTVGAYPRGATARAAGSMSSMLDRAAMSVDGSRIWVAADGGGLFWSPGDATSWVPLENAPFGDSVWGMSASPHDVRVLFVLTASGEIWAYREPDPAP